jgi:hemolysin activation/secretion protein
MRKQYLIFLFIFFLCINVFGASNLQQQIQKEAQIQKGKENAKKNTLDQTAKQQENNKIKDSYSKQEEGSYTIKKAPVKKLKISDDADGKICYTFNKIIVKGNTLLSAKIINSVTLKYQNKCITLQLAQEVILDEFIKLYNSAGYTLASVFLPQQDIKNSKELIIQVNEGKLERIDFDPDILPPINVKLAFLNVIGKPVNMKVVDNALDVLNNSGKYSVNMEIQQGTEDGNAIIILNAKLNDKYTSQSIGTTYSYNKSSKASPIQPEYFLNTGELFLPNDTLFLNAGSDISLTDFNKSYSGNASFTYSLPINGWMFSFIYEADGFQSKDYVEGDPVNGVESFTTLTESFNYFISFDATYNLYRSSTTLTKVSFVPHFGIQKLWVEGDKIPGPSEKLSYMDFKVDYTYHSQKGTFHIGGVYTYGYPFFDAQKMTKNPYYVPQTLFSVYGLTIDYNRPLTEKLQFKTIFRIQYSRDTLPVNLDFNASSSQSVRAYEGLIYEFQCGFVSQNTFTYKLARFDNPYFSGLSLALSFDIGANYDDVRYFILTHNYKTPLMGWYSEFVVDGKVNLSVGFGTPIDGEPETYDYYPVVKVKLTYNF